MKTGSLAIWMVAVVFVFSGSWAFADCPSADRTGDCFVDFEDFAVIGANWPNGYDWNDVNTLANQWLTTDPCVPDDMVYIPDGEFVMGDHFSPEGDDARSLGARSACAGGAISVSAGVGQSKGGFGAGERDSGARGDEAVVGGLSFGGGEAGAK
jgi:hypothetical protein